MDYSAWKGFLKENKSDTETLLLVEARVKDIKKKYPLWDDAGWINRGRQRINDVLGPKGVSKYLLWLIRELAVNFEGDPADASPTNISDVEDELLAAIFKFQENQARIEEKDIYKYNSAELQKLIRDLDPSRSEADKAEMKEALRESEIIYETDSIFGVRPETAGASCYFGRNTRWCISAEQSRNYFDQYTEDGQSFVMLRLKHLAEKDDDKRIALVFDRNGEFDEAYDAPDASMGLKEVQNAIAKNIAAGRKDPNYGPGGDLGSGYAYSDWYEDASPEAQEEVDVIIQDIFNNAEQSVLNNPPTPDYEAQAEKVMDQYEFKHAHASYDMDGDYFYFSGGLSVTFPEPDFEGGEYVLPSGWSEESAFTRELGDAVNSELGIYPDEITINSYNNEVEITLSANSGDYEANPRGLESFLDNEVDEYERKYDEIKSVIKKYLMDEGYMPSSEFHNLYKTIGEMEDSLSIMKVDPRRSDHQSIVIKATRPLTYVPKSPGELGALSSPHVIPRYEAHITDLTVDNLRELDIKLKNYLEKQLELPISDLPPKIQKRLTIPSSFKLEVRFDMATSIVAYPRVEVRHDDSDVLIAEALSIAGYLEENYNVLQDAFIEAMATFSAEFLQSIRQNSGDPRAVPGTVQEQVEDYLASFLSERSRQYDIYEFYLMLGYTPQKDDENKMRGLEHIVADIRAIPSVTVVSIKVKNQRLSESDYVAGLKIKFIPSLPGVLRSPEDAKLKILQMIKATKGVRRIFKVSPRFEKSTL